MRHLFVGLFILAWLVPTHAAAQAGTIRITAPASGDLLLGLIDVTGTSAVEGFLASDLSFAYVSDSTSTWFLIYETDQPVSDGLLAVWDTASITDGDYNLRLRVTLQDGTLLESLVTGLRLRNQTPTETPVPSPTATLFFDLRPISSPLPPTPMPAPTSTRLPTPTPLPPNPVSLTLPRIYFFLSRGILITLLAFTFVGIFLRLRRN